MLEDEVTRTDKRIPPVRGLVLTENAKGKPYATADVRRWIRLNRVMHKAEKVDMLVSVRGMSRMPEWLACGKEVDVRISLRTHCGGPPGDLAALKAAGLFDVFACPREMNGDFVDAWLDACQQAQLPLRIQLQAPFAEPFEPDSVAERLANAGVKSVNVALFDTFLDKTGCADQTHSRRTLDLMNDLAEALERREVEANLLGLPLCMVRDVNLPRAENSQQFFMDHQQYQVSLYELAQKLYRRGPFTSGKALQVLLGRFTMQYNAIDEWLLPWLMQNPWIYARMALWRKIVRHKRFFSKTPKPADMGPEAFEKEAERLRARAAKEMGAECARCRMRDICDHASAQFKRALPGLEIAAIEGDKVASPMHFAAGRRKYYDLVDSERAAWPKRTLELAMQAEQVMVNRPADRQVTPLDYGVEKTLFNYMEGGIRWHSLSNSEQLSTVLTRVHAPCTLSLMVGGGVAEYAGFSFGRHCKLLCPMESYRHSLVVHVDADGHYVFMRDGTPVQPAEFERAPYVPLRLGSVLEPRISLWNIDQTIVTQSLDVWEDEGDADKGLGRIKYSIVVVCARYARRLQAALSMVAHQEGLDLRDVEIIISYVPGIDATDDLIDSMQMAYPDLRIVRAPFAEQYATSKGFRINESLHMASGEWVVLLDADTLLPPNWFAEVDKVGKDCHFVATDGRKMLSKEVTARILMGEIVPWRDWQELLKGAGEFRLCESEKVPIGFCQCVRRECFEKVKYEEMDHFEGADMLFGVKMRQEFGLEKRLSGLPAIHLDHGGSQWYGALRHF